MSRNTGTDNLITGSILVIGFAETAHLAAILLDWPLSMCLAMFWGLAALACICGVCLGGGLLLSRRRGKAVQEGGPEARGLGKKSLPEILLWATFAALALTQLLYLVGRGYAFRQGDIMVETVGSFLETDGIYQVNPLTGQPYSEGLPLRLQILCLPTLYAALCRVTGLAPAIIVRTAVPALTLLGCYCALASLGRSLFPRGQGAEEGQPDGSGVRLGCFMVVAALLLWAGANTRWSDGFNLLYCGWEGITIRNCVLVPWELSLCIRRKWQLVPLCILAEACIVWTLYGMGVCLGVTVGMTFAWLGHGLFTKKAHKPDGGKEKAK